MASFLLYNASVFAMMPKPTHCDRRSLRLTLVCCQVLANIG
ncbi:hypothetical protein [Nodosilinea sp. LEGE 07088]|nr:hypothetical protein [Nodosilinea sp. LEGE 07088]